MTQEKSVLDKRRHPRHEIDFIATLDVGIRISGKGHTVNVSQGGVGIEAPNLFSTVKPKKIKQLLGSVVTIFFPFEALTIEGQIAWIDEKKGAFGLSVYKFSDLALWNKICKKG